jgi:polar amino acid transport system substrate-binding protein
MRKTHITGCWVKDCWVIGCWLLALFCAGLAQAQTLSLVTAALPPLAPSAQEPGYMTRIAREAFGRLGLGVEVTALPGERALINANAGLDDGDLLRIPGLEQEYPNLVRVPEKVMDFEFVAYTRDPAIRIQSIADLKPYTVAYATGWKFYEASVTEAADITRVRDLPELFLLLKAGRVEVVLADRWQGRWAARAVGVEVILQQPPFRVSDMYIYLHRRHAALVPQLAEALAAMKADGSFQRIADESLKPLESR